jgi:hypothetical protein
MLNPIKILWQFLRQTKLSNCVFDRREAIVAAACEARDSIPAIRLVLHRSRLASGLLPLAIHTGCPRG